MFSPVSASEAGEVVDLLLILLIVPLTIVTMKGMRFPGRRWLSVGFFVIVGVRLFSLVERHMLGNPVFPIKQFLIAAAGVAFAAGVWQLAVALRRGELL